MTTSDEYKQTLKKAAIALLEMQNKLDVGRSEKVEDKIAIIGAACRFPGHIKTLEEYWIALDSGKDCISEVPIERFDVDEYFNIDADKPGVIYTKAGGFIDNAEKFDAAFFGISPKEALSMDPQQRIFLEVSWEALESACIPPSSIQGSKTGIYVGVATHDYITFEMYSGRPTSVDDYSFTGTASSVLAARLAYYLDLHGPCMSIDTACSSSLVAIHEACKSLLSNESDMAVAGGVNLILSPENTVYFCRINALSRRGICNTFDEKADGYVRSEGCGVVILKRLSDAIKDHDNILAVISSSAINQDGRSNGLTAPNGIAQEQLIHDAIKNAGVDSTLVKYVEAHGTGTKLGDPIEVRALSNVYGKNRNHNEPLFISSVKSQIGHLEAAAGVASVIKVCLSLRHKKIPGTINLSTLNSNIPWSEIPVVAPTSTIDWPEINPRIAAVNSFGLSGTNAHIILESFETTVNTNSSSKYHILTISAKSSQALKDYIIKYRDFIQNNKELNIVDICTTSNLCKEHFKFRFAIVAESNTELIQKLNNFLNNADNVTKEISKLDKTPHEEIADLYIGNENIDWNKLHLNTTYNKVPLPSYPFQHEAYMLEKQKKSLDYVVLSNYNENLAYVFDWEKSLLKAHDSENFIAKNTCIILCCKANSTIFKKTKSIFSDNANFILITYGDKFKKVLGNHFEVDVTSLSMLQDFFNCCNVDFNYEHIHLLYTKEYSSHPILNFGDNYTEELEKFASLLKHLNVVSKEKKLKYNVWLLADNLHYVHNKASFDKISQASLWGLGKVALLEMSRMFKGMFDLEVDSNNFTYQFNILCRKIQSDDIEPEIVFRNKEFYLPRINKFSSTKNQHILNDLQINSGACYLISGGFGGLGLEIAKWLSENGAKELILISRHATFNKNESDFIENLSRNGVKLHIISCDIADYIKLKIIFEELNLQNRLKGVIHAAGSYTSEAINQLDKSNIQNILTPKIQGLLVLHELTKDIKIDFFVAFSSISAVWGAKNYGAYAAANYFMNIFMEHRIQSGLPGISINWGPWDRVGMAMYENRKEQFIMGGIKPIPPELALNMMEFVIRLDKNNLIIADIDWKILTNSFSHYTTKNIFKSIKYNSPKEVVENKDNNTLDNNPVEPDKLKLVMQYIISEAVKSLNLKSEEMFDIEKTFLEQGMDSIAAIHFCKAIRDNLSLDFVIPSQNVFSYPTVEKLAIYLINQIAINKKAKLSIDSQPRLNNELPKTHGAVLTVLNNIVDKQLPPCLFIHSGLGDTNYALLFLQDIKRPCYGISLVPGAKYESYEDIVNDYVTMAQSVLNQKGELFLVGYSFGGTIAWEMANKLTRLGYTILNLILLDAPALDIKSDNNSTFKDVFHKVSEDIIIDKIIADDDDYSLYKLSSSELKRLQMIKTVFAEALHSSLNIEKLPVDTIHQLYAYSKIAFLVIDQLYDLSPYAGKVTLFVPFVSRPKEIERVKDMCKIAPEIIYVNGDHFNMVYESELHDVMHKILS